MSQIQQPSFPVHPVVGEWLKDPEFQKLPEDMKTSAIGNFFDREIADDGFAALPEEKKQSARDNFMAVHTTPELSFSRIGGAIAHEVKQYPGRVATSVRSNADYVPEADDSNINNLVHDPISGPAVLQRAEELRQDRWMPRQSALRIAANEIETQRRADKSGIVQSLSGIEESLTPARNPEYDGKSSGILEDAVRGLAGSAPDMAIMAVSPVAGAASMYANMQGGKQRELETSGVNTNRAFKASSASAAAQAPMEMLSDMLQLRAVGKLAKSTLAKNLTHLAESALGEGFTEYVQQYPDEFANLWAANPQLSPAEMRAESARRLPEIHSRAVQAGKVGALAGSLLPGAGIAVKAPIEAYRVRRDRIKTGASVDLIKERSALTGLEEDQNTPEAAQQHTAAFPGAENVPTGPKVEMADPWDGLKKRSDGKPFAAKGADLFIKNKSKQGQAWEAVEVTPGSFGVREVAVPKPTITEAAHEAATSPENDLPQPTEAQKEAGNYRKGHVSIGGLNISIENPAGSERSGTDANGNPWSVTMTDHYGYIRGTEGKDGDHVDVFINPATEREQVGESPVFVIDQIDPKTGKFDEHKAMMGYPDAASAESGYKSNYAEGWNGVGAITPMSFAGFKEWTKNGKTKRPVGKIAKKSIETTGNTGAVPADVSGGISAAPVNLEDRLYSLSTSALNDVALRSGIEPAGNRVDTVEALAAQKTPEQLSRLIDEPEAGEGNTVAVSRGGSRGSLAADELQGAVAPLQSVAVNSLPVRVVQSMANLPQHIQAEARKGKGVVDAAYDGAFIYLVADHIATPDRAVALWMHENGLHNGLRSMMSPTDYKRLLNQVWLSAGGKNAFQNVAKRYGLDLSTKEGQQTASEEYLAKIAEKVTANQALTAREKSMWRKLVEGVLSFLRKAGIDLKLTDFEIAGIVQDAVRWTIHGERSESGVHVFSGGEVAASSRDITPEESGAQLQKDMDEWAKQLDRVNSGEIHPRAILHVGTTPEVFKALGAKELPITMTNRVHKILNEKHKIALSTLKNLPQLLSEPLMVFDSATVSGSLVALTSAQHNGKPVIVALHLDVREGSLQVNDVASVYGKDGAKGWIKSQVDAGRLRYWDKKKYSEVQRMSGLQLPRAFELRSNKKILTEKDIVKPVLPENNVALSLAPSTVVKSIAGDEVRDLFSSGDLSKLREIISLPHWIAKNHAGFKAVYDVQLKRMDDRAKRLASAVEQAQDVWDAPQHVVDEVADVIWKLEGKKIKEIGDTPKFRKVEGEDGRPEYKGGRAKLEINPEYTAVFDAWMAKQDISKDAQKVLRSVRKVLDDALLRAYDHMRNMNEVSDDAIAQFRTTINHIHNYFPHQRYGDYFVAAYADVDGKRQVVWRQHYDAMTTKAGLAKIKGRKLIQQIRKDNPELAAVPMKDWSIGPVQKLPEDVYSTKIDTMAMEQIMHRATESIANGEQAKEIKDALSRAIADTLKARGWGSHMIGRKGIPGYEKQDIRRVLYDYMSGESGWETKMEAAKGFAKALGTINAKELPADYRYTLAYVEDMLRNADSADRMVGNIKAVAFLWYLGVNFKTATLNLTQNVISGAPRLGMDLKHSFHAYTYLSKACKDVVAGAKGESKLPADEQRLLKELYQEGTIAANYLDEIQGRIGMRKGLGMWDKTLSYAGLFMAVAERFNRASLALAAYRSMRDGKTTEDANKRHVVEGDIKPEEKAYLQAKSFAEEVTRDAHFVYGKANQPQFIRHSTVGRSFINPMYTFRTFSHNLLSFWRWALGQGGPGVKAVMQSIAGTMALGGIKAAPFFATASALWQWASGDDDDPVEEIRKALPEGDFMRDMVIYGLPAAAGVDFGGSLSVEAPILSELEPGATAEDVMGKNISDIFGIPWDLAVRKPSRVAKAMKSGDYLRGFEEAAPTSLKNVLGAYRMSTDGQLSLSGKPISDPGDIAPRKFSVGEAASKALGFQPLEASKAWDKTNARQLSAKARADALAGMASRLATALRHGNQEGLSDAMGELTEYNARQMEQGKAWMVILPDEFKSAVQGRMMGGKIGKRETARYLDQQHAYAQE